MSKICANACVISSESFFLLRKSCRAVKGSSTPRSGSWPLLANNAMMAAGSDLFCWIHCLAVFLAILALSRLLIFEPSALNIRGMCAYWGGW